MIERDIVQDTPAIQEQPGGSILVVDDDDVLRYTLVDLLSGAGFAILDARDGEQAMRTIQGTDVDLVLTDLVMPGTGGEALLGQVRRAFPALPVVVMTSFGSVESAVMMIQHGAADYLTKPLALEKLLSTVRRVLHATKVQRDHSRATRRNGMYLAGLVGTTPRMRQLFEQIGRVAGSTVPVLITGETGVGKELVAHAVHRASGREAFVAVNASAMPSGLLESELFGHVRGAFTGAERDKIGLFEAAHDGTLFLDEIGELALALQAKLLRVLQSGEFRRVGDTASRHAQVRLIAATHRDLPAAVRAATFREDLFYRINVLQLDVPPLRDRSTDVLLLAQQFLADVTARDGAPVKQFSAAAHACLAAFRWPGNVRQLRNVVERAAVLTDADVIDVDDLPVEISGATPAALTERRLGDDVSLADVEREHVLAVLAREGGNRSRAARALGIPRRTLYRRLADWGILPGRR